MFVHEVMAMVTAKRVDAALEMQCCFGRHAVKQVCRVHLLPSQQSMTLPRRMARDAVQRKVSSAPIALP